MTVYFYGTSEGEGAQTPLPQTSIVIDAGEQLVFTLSGGNPAQGIAAVPGFQGYVIAVCEFRHARGFATIINGAGQLSTISQSYLAEVLPEERK